MHKNVDNVYPNVYPKLLIYVNFNNKNLNPIIMVGIAIVFRKGKFNKNRYAPAHLRIIKERKINYITTVEMLAEIYWEFTVPPVCLLSPGL